MKITVLDGFALNPGDLSWEALGKLGEVQVFDRTAPSEVAERDHSPSRTAPAWSATW